MSYALAIDNPQSQNGKAFVFHELYTGVYDCPLLAKCRCASVADDCYCN